MGKQTTQRTYSQRQLRVGEMVKQNLGELFIRDENLILDGVYLGFGFSKDFSRWSTLPEGTILIDPQNTNDYIWKVGI